jgi:hypothetical protein
MAQEPLGQGGQENQEEDEANADRAEDHLHLLCMPAVEVSDLAG